MNDTKSGQVGLWYAIAGVAGFIALLNGLDTALSNVPLLIETSFFSGNDEAPVLIAVYLFVILIFPLSLVVSVAALTKRSGIALYGSSAILLSSLLWRVIEGAVFGGVTLFLPFVALFSEFAFEDFPAFVFSAYVALDIVLAGVLLILTILQHRRLQSSESEPSPQLGASARAAGTVFCKECGTPGREGQFCQGCGSKLDPVS